MYNNQGQYIIERCRGKMSYDKKSAISFLNKHPFGDGNKKLRMYQCPDCGHWHITKKQWR